MAVLKSFTIFTVKHLYWIIEIENALCFDQHISKLCKNANNQLNTIGRIQKYMDFEEKEVLLKQFM